MTQIQGYLRSDGRKFNSNIYGYSIILLLNLKGRNLALIGGGAPQVFLQLATQLFSASHRTVVVVGEPCYL